RFDAAEPLVDESLSPFAPFGDGDERNSPAPVALQPQRLLQVRHGHKAVDPVMIGRLKPSLAVPGGVQVRMKVDDQSPHLRARHGAAKINAKEVVVRYGRGVLTHFAIEV